jgi:hypothetical protein
VNSDQVAALGCAAAAVLMFAALVVFAFAWRRIRATNLALRAKNQQLTEAFDGLARVADQMPQKVADRIRYAQVIAHLPARLFDTPSTKEKP